MFWDIRRWHSIWSPVDAVKVNYDDGRHQEFTMALRWLETDVTIRTLRFMEPQGDISFFSPNPPPEMSSHVGKWGFKAIENGCLITILREYKLMRMNFESGDEHSLRATEFKRVFEARLDNLLRAFQRHYTRSGDGLVV